MISFYTMELTAPSTGGELCEMLPIIYTFLLIRCFLAVLPRENASWQFEGGISFFFVFEDFLFLLLHSFRFFVVVEHFSCFENVYSLIDVRNRRQGTWRKGEV